MTTRNPRDTRNPRAVSDTDPDDQPLGDDSSLTDSDDPSTAPMDTLQGAPQDNEYANRQGSDGLYDDIFHNPERQGGEMF